MNLEHQTMNLVNLPDEILMIILKQLDVRSLHNLHTACDHIRNIIRTYGAIKTCNLSLSVMAKAETLKSIFFQDISRNLQDLNVSGVCDLYKTHLLQAVKRLKCLKILDVTYTNITMTDFIDIYKLCPTITDISINFSLDKPLNKILLNTYQYVFKNMLNIHFVGNLYDILLSQMACFILKRATLKKLKYTIFDFHFDSPNFLNPLQHKDILHFDNFMIYISNIKKDDYIYDDYMIEMVPFKLLDFESFETIIIKNQCATKPKCYASSIFMNFFSKYCNPPLYDSFEFHIINNFDVHLEGNVFVMLWNKSVTQFDEKFFSNLWCILKPFLPCYFDSSTNTAVAPEYDLYVTVPQAKKHELEAAQEDFKRKRVVAPSYVLNYDSAFQGKSKVQLALKFDFSNMIRSVTLSASCDYLKKLTYLSLSGPVRCSSDFFNILFRCCHNLATLIVKDNCLNSYSAAISRSLPLSQSLKNIHLTDSDIDLQRLFSSMSQCKTLENVHIVNTNFANFTDPSVVFENCKNLYCFYVYLHSTPSALKKIMIKLNKANRKKINARLLLNNRLLCDPYSEVFNLDVLGNK